LDFEEIAARAAALSADESRGRMERAAKERVR
jgi:hypothetical protein